MCSVCAARRRSGLRRRPQRGGPPPRPAALVLQQSREARAACAVVAGVLKGARRRALRRGCRPSGALGWLGLRGVRGAVGVARGGRCGEGAVVVARPAVGGIFAGGMPSQPPGCAVEALPAGTLNTIRVFVSAEIDAGLPMIQILPQDRHDGPAREAGARRESIPRPWHAHRKRSHRPPSRPPRVGEARRTSLGPGIPQT